MGITKCNKCGHEKTWKGDDITCPFQEGDVFGENWNCGIIGRFQTFLYSVCWWGNKERPEWLTWGVNNDQYDAFLRLDGIQLDYYRNHPSVLYVTWYKRRGAIDNMLLLGEGEPRKPTYRDLETIADGLGLELVGGESDG